MSRKIPDGHFEDLLFYVFLALFICILLSVSVFGDFSNIYQSSAKHCATLGHLNRYLKKKSRKSSTILYKNVKLMYEEVCQVSRRYLY